MHETEDKIQPLTKGQASDLCQLHQHLNEQNIVHNGKSYFVDKVVVAPYDDINKWIFLHHYRETKHAVHALSFYHVPFYDVILIVQQQKDSTLNYIDLKAYLK
jgi:hypothetical protein